MTRHRWKDLNSQQTGRYAEYFVKMELAMYGFEIYTSEVDDRGIDFVARKGPGSFLEIQVKSLRSHGYVFMRKRHFPLQPNAYLALVLLLEGVEPELFLIPSETWLTPNAVFVDRNYEGLKSEPEWGLNISNKNMSTIEDYAFDKVVDNFAFSIKG